MRERISRLAKGIVEYETPLLEVSSSKIEENVRTNVLAKGEFYAASGNGIHLKGLVYSSNPRVRVVNESFGGIKNRIVYEVRSNYLENGDVIEGYFHLITNGGELEIPYFFGVEIGASGKVLGSLNSVEKYGELARCDLDTALRLFEYQDFVEAPFMQDIRIRTIYDGLKGYGSRQNQLEEFLVGIGAKDAITIVSSEEEKIYEYSDTIFEDKLVFEKNTWGYVQMELETDCSFLILDKTIVNSSDFNGNLLELTFQVNPRKLHCGRNYGRIKVILGDETLTVPILVMGKDCMNTPLEDALKYKECIHKYIELRLDYESGLFERSLLFNQMQEELNKIKNNKELSDDLALLQAELYAKQGKLPEAIQILDDRRNQILSGREENLETYCFYQYLQVITHRNEGQRDSLVRLVRKYHEEEPKRFYLFLLLMKLDSTLSDNPSLLLVRMKKQYKKGCYSPFLYVEACKIFEEEPDLLRAMDAFELQSLYFGARHAMIDNKLGLVIAQMATYEKGFQKIYFRLLTQLFKRYPQKEVLNAICCILIKGDCRNEEYFEWYEKGVEDGIRLTRLYEYYLFTLPKAYHKALPQEVLLYFSYDHSLDYDSKTILYINILKYQPTDYQVYKAYERQMEQFALDQLFEGRIDENLALLYRRMIFRDLIDEKIAKVFPALLRSNQILCDNPIMSYVVVCYEELAEEELVPLRKGKAYVPLYSNHCVILFQDSYGNRFMNVKYKKEPVMEEPELEQRCFEVYPNHPMLRLRVCKEAVDAGALMEDTVEFMVRALDEMRLNRYFQKKILSLVVNYYEDLTEDEDEVSRQKKNEYLLKVDKRRLNGYERARICEAFIVQEYYKEAFDMIKEYGYEEIKTSRLLKLCAKTILNNLFDQDPLLLAIAADVFREGKFDSVTLDYLCEHYNGTEKEMFAILTQAIRDHVETYDLEERLLAQMMFSGQISDLDMVFELYVTRKKAQDYMVKAYFTLKSFQYFMDDVLTTDKVFTYLEGEILRTIQEETTPIIYLLALTNYYSVLKQLKEEQISLCASMITQLCGKGFVFAYMQKLAKHIDMPCEIMDKCLIQYKSSKDRLVELKTRILPDEEEYKKGVLPHMYQGIFVKQITLFDGEIVEYQIFEEIDQKMELIKEGSQGRELEVQAGVRDRFSYLNDIGLCINLKDAVGLKKQMNHYIVKSNTAEKLFTLL